MLQIPGISLLEVPGSLRRLLGFVAAAAAHESLGLRDDALPRVAHGLGVADGGICKGEIVLKLYFVGSICKAHIYDMNGGCSE